MEANGSSSVGDGTPRPLTVYDLVRNLDQDAEAVAHHERHLAAARTAERRSRERIVAVLRGRGGKPFSCGGRLFRPLHSARGYTAHDPGNIVDFEIIEYDPSSSVRVDQSEVDPAAAALATAAHDFTPVPPDLDPPPFGVEPRNPGRRGRPAEAAAVAVTDDDGEG